MRRGNARETDRRLFLSRVLRSWSPVRGDRQHSRDRIG